MSSDAVKVLKALITPGGWIQFPVSFLSVMSAKNAVLLCELINQWKIETEELFEFSVEDVERRLRMDRHSQWRGVSKLADMNLIMLRVDRAKNRRLVEINWEEIAAVLADEKHVVKVQHASCESATDHVVKVQHASCESATSVLREEEDKEEDKQSVVEHSSPTKRSGASSFQLDDEKPEQEQTPEMRITHHLHELLLNHRLIVSTVNVRRWSKKIKQALEHRTEEELTNLLVWYDDHLNDEFVPKICSAGAFVDKMVSLEAARRRAAPPKENGQEQMPEEERQRRIAVFRAQWMIREKKRYIEKTQKQVWCYGEVGSIEWIANWANKKDGLKPLLEEQVSHLKDADLRKIQIDAQEKVECQNLN